jgi:hypothetical protein
MEEQKNTNYLMLAVIAVGLFFGGKYGYEWYMVNKIFDNVIKHKPNNANAKLIDYKVDDNNYYYCVYI